MPVGQSTNTKVCTGCKTEKSLVAFSKKSTGRFGLDSRCKLCIAERDKKARTKINVRNRSRYRSDPDYRKKVLKKNKEWAEDNCDQKLEYLRGWKREHPEKVSNYWKTHYKKHRSKYFEKSIGRDKRVRSQTPPWADLEDIKRVYRLARKISERTGVPHEVDHIVPLKGANVSGLHTFRNLRVVTAKENRSKGSRPLDPERKRDFE